MIKFMGNITCDKCFAQNLPNAKFCSQCGYELPKFNTTIEDIMSTGSTRKPSKRNAMIVLASGMGLIFFAGMFLAVKSLLSFDTGFDKQLKLEANELNKSCPMMIDAVTQLDNAAALPDNTFQYNYTLIDADVAQMDTIQFKANLEPSILEQVKSNPQLKSFRDHQVTLQYVYKDKRKHYLTQIVITPEMYK
jgi:hypothetical protein